MNDDQTICNCMGVTRKEIITAIKEKGCTTFEEVQNETEASTVCGGCEDDVRDILKEHGY